VVSDDQCSYDAIWSTWCTGDEFESGNARLEFLASSKLLQDAGDMYVDPADSLTTSKIGRAAPAWSSEKSLRPAGTEPHDVPRQVVSMLVSCLWSLRMIVLSVVVLE
jgi:hypothetical protein